MQILNCVGFLQQNLIKSFQTPIRIHGVQRTAKKNFFVIFPLIFGEQETLAL